MSNLRNEAILERHFEDASELTRHALFQELEITIFTSERYWKEISDDDLAATVAFKRFNESPDGPC